VTRLRYDPPRWQTAGTYCTCGHHRDVHERTAAGVFRKCSGVRADGGQCVCLNFEAQAVRR